MRTVTLLFFILSTTISAQTFVELCADQTSNGTLVNFDRYQDQILATGFFTTICGEATDYVAEWDGNQWTPSTISLPFAGHFMKPIGDDLFFATYAEGPDSNWLWKYDGSTLEKFGPGVYLTGATEFSNLPNIYDVIDYQGDLIICGEFDKVGDQNINGIARWNGSSWEEFGQIIGNIPSTPPYIFPHQMKVLDDELYVVGNFSSVGGKEVNGIAKWDGSEWTALGAGFNSTVYTLGMYNGELYAGGDFTESGGEEILRFAKWNGNQWESPGFGFQPANSNDYTFIHTLEVIDDELWVLGGLKEIVYNDGSIALCGGVISYDGATVTTFNEGILNNDIEAIIKDDQGELLVGGGIFGNGYSGILDLTIDAKAIAQATSFTIFPNPCAERLQIESSEEVLAYQLQDVFGKVVSTAELPDKSITVDGIASGIYLLSVKTTNGWQTQKVVKQ